MSRHPSRINLPPYRVAWWAFIPRRWRLFFAVAPYVPMPWSLIRRGFRAEVAAGYRWRAAPREGGESQ